MKLSSVTIWIWDEYLADAEIQEAIKDFGGIGVFGKNAKELAKNCSERDNIYPYNDKPSWADVGYVGEFGTQRIDYPTIEPLYTYADESSPYRLSFAAKVFLFLGYSSYRPTLFTIPTKSSDINIRVPILSPVLTLKHLDSKYGVRHKFIWIDLKKNLYFCYPYRTFLDPYQKEKSWSFKPFLRIPFGWHVKAMVKFAERFYKRVLIYAGDYDVSKEDVLKRLKIIKQYFEV